ncbi:MAG TPA: pilus assembly protein PilM [Stenomitos sp.]
MKTPTSFVGLYIAGDRIEAVLPANADGSIEETYTYPLPPDILTEDGTVASVDELSAVLREAWKALGLREKKVVLVLNSRQAIVRLVRLPHLPLTQLHHAILSEAEQFALFRNDTPLVDYFVASEDGDFIWVCYGAAAETLVQPFDQALKAAGLKLAGIELVQLAGQRGMAYYHPPEEYQWIGVMLLPQRLIVTSWHEGRLTAVRELVLPERDNISMELVALNYLPDAVRSVAGSNPNSSPQLIIGAQRIEDARDLAAHAEAHIKLPIRIAEPADVDPGVELPSCVALGAATWKRPDSFPSFNLMQGKGTSFELPNFTNFSFSLDGLSDNLKSRAVPIIAGVLVVAVMAGAGIVLSSQNKESVSSLKVKLSAAETERDGLKQQVDQTPPEQEVLQQWIPHHSETKFAADLVSRLRNIVPEDAWVSRIYYLSGQEMRLQGAALSQTSCLYFADQLGAVDTVTQVRILRLEKQGSSYAFELQASLGRKQKAELLP